MNVLPSRTTTAVCSALSASLEGSLCSPQAEDLRAHSPPPADSGCHCPPLSAAERPPTQACRLLSDAIRLAGISKPTLQRYWQADVTTFRKTLCKPNQPPPTLPRTRFLPAPEPGRRPGSPTRP